MWDELTLSDKEWFALTVDMLLEVSDDIVESGRDTKSGVFENSTRARVADPGREDETFDLE